MTKEAKLVEKFRFDVIESLVDQNIIAPNVFGNDLTNIFLMKNGSYITLVDYYRNNDKYIELTDDEKKNAIYILSVCSKNEKEVLKAMLEKLTHLAHKMPDVMMYYFCKMEMWDSAIGFLKECKFVSKTTDSDEKTAISYACDNVAEESGNAVKYINLYCETNPYKEPVELIFINIHKTGNEEAIASIKKGMSYTNKISVLKKTKHSGMIDELFEDKSLEEKLDILKEHDICDRDEYENKEMDTLSGEAVLKLYITNPENRKIKKLLKEKLDGKSIFNAAILAGDDNTGRKYVEWYDGKNTNQFLTLVKKKMVRTCEKLIMESLGSETESKVNLQADYNGKKILELLYENELSNLVVVLLKNTKFDIEDIEKCFMHACRDYGKSNTDMIVKTMLEKYKIVNRIIDGKTGLIVACEGKNEDVIELLCESGADIKIKGPHGSALMVLLKNENLKKMKNVYGDMYKFIRNCDPEEYESTQDGKFKCSILTLMSENYYLDQLLQRYEKQTIFEEEAYVLSELNSKQVNDFLEKVRVVKFNQ